MSDTAAQASRLEDELRDILHVAPPSTNLDFFVSSLTEVNPFHSTAELGEWLAGLNEKLYFDVERRPLAELENWAFDDWSGDLQHASGRFFSIRGLDVSTNGGPVAHWSQPIIHQPEIGVLGIVTKKIDGVLYLLLQAKAEPGNINTFQLSPTVQATRSNYMQVHGGARTRYIEYFLDPSRARVLLDQMQSEQGARFYQKRNRNIVVRIGDDEDIEVGEHFRWFTLAQVKRLARRDNTVNMDTRSVISMICYDPEHKSSLAAVDAGRLRECLGGSPLVHENLVEPSVRGMVSAHGNSASMLDDARLLQRLTAEKFGCDLDARLIPLNEVKQWRRGPDDISHVDGRYFSVIGVHVRAGDREVTTWDQPIVRQVDTGIVGCILADHDGVLHCLVQMKMESGNMDVLEIAPTVQCITDSYAYGDRPEYLDRFLDPPAGTVVLDTLQSEEGGRFYREENRNVILYDEAPASPDLPPRYMWCTVRQLKELLKYNNYLNVESRSLLSLL